MIRGRVVAVILCLACGAAWAEPPADAPRIEQVDGGYFLNASGFKKLEQFTDRLQIENHALAVRNADLERRVADLEAAPQLSTPAVVALVSTSIALGIVAGWKLKELVP